MRLNFIFRTGRKIIFPALFAQEGGYCEFIINWLATAGPDEALGVGRSPVFSLDAFASAPTAVGIGGVAGKMFFCEIHPVKLGEV